MLGGGYFLNGVYGNFGVYIMLEHRIHIKTRW